MTRTANQVRVSQALRSAFICSQVSTPLSSRTPSPSRATVVALMSDSPITHSAIMTRKTSSATYSCAVTGPSRFSSHEAMAAASGVRRISGRFSA